MKRLLLAVSFAVLSCAAYAADAVVEEVVVDVQPGFSWTGGYVGLQAGYAWGDSHLVYLPEGDYSDPEPDGWLGGVYLGYNYQMPSNVVVGVDADLTYNDANGFGEGFFGDGSPAGPGTGNTVDMNWSGAVRARLGYAADRFLPYIAGGVAFADVDYNLLIDGAAVSSDSDTTVGWTIGAGVEYAFTDAIIGRFEYRYTDYGTANFDFGGGPSEGDLETSDIRFGVAWKW